MTLDEAIQHAKDVAQNEKCDKSCNLECAKEHEQLANWLEELKKLRQEINKIQ